MAFDDGSVVLVTEADLEGYDPNHESGAVGSKLWTDLRLVYKIQVGGQAALARLSCLWFRCHSKQISSENLPSEKSGYPIATDQLGVLRVDIHVY